jgi:hypothetical protein
MASKNSTQEEIAQFSTLVPTLPHPAAIDLGDCIFCLAFFRKLRLREYLVWVISQI